MQALGEGTIDLIRQYYLATHQAEWWHATFGAIGPTSLRQVCEAILRDCPQDVGPIARLICRRLSAADPLEAERQRLRQEVHQAFNIDTPAFLDDGIGPGWPGFEAFQARPAYPSVQQAYDATLAWADGSGPPLLVLSGSTGVGKTHLARAAAALLRQRGREVVYREEARMMADIRQGFGRRDAEAWIEAFSSCLWLVLDELGAIALDDTFRGIQDRIINARWSNAPALRTLVTTNLESKDLPPRIASRLGDVHRGLAIVVKAPDYRRQKEA